MLKVTSDITRHLLRVEHLSSEEQNRLWDQDAVERVRAEMLAEAEKLRAGGLPFDMIANLDNLAVQTGETAAAMQEIEAELYRMGMRRVASVVLNPLTKLQVTRVAVDANTRIFTSEEEALAWLSE